MMIVKIPIVIITIMMITAVIITIVMITIVIVITRIVITRIVNPLSSSSTLKAGLYCSFPWHYLSLKFAHRQKQQHALGAVLLIMWFKSHDSRWQAFMSVLHICANCLSTSSAHGLSSEYGIAACSTKLQ